MTKNFLEERIESETEWFLANAELADKVPDAERLVRRLLLVADERKFSFREAVVALSQWLDDHPKKRNSMKRVGQFYVQCFLKQTSTPKPETQTSRTAYQPPPPVFTNWMKGVPDEREPRA